MLEKWKQRAIRMNFKKAVIIYIIIGFALVILCSACVYNNFQNRIAEWEQLAESERAYGKEERYFDEGHKSEYTDREHDEDFREHDEKDWEEIYKRLYLSAGDIALIGSCCVIGMAMGVWYWLLVMIWAYRKAYRMGVNTTLWVIAALFFNIAAIAALYLYEMWKGTCTNCGKIRNGSEKFCDRCGMPLKKEYPQCGKETNILSVYCSNCGKKLDEDKK